MTKVIGKINGMCFEGTREECEEYIRECEALDEKYYPDGLDDCEEYSIEEDYASNMPCDFSGYCAGTSCPRYFECQR